MLGGVLISLDFRITLMKKLFSLIVLFLLSVPSHAAVWIVTSTADVDVPGTLRHAVIGAAANDTIKFDPGLTGSVISLLLGELKITKSLTIIGLGPTNLAIVNYTDRVFHVFRVMENPVTASITGLKITGHLKGARGTDALFGLQHGTSGVSVTGGGIQNDSLCVLTVSNCFFSGCQAIGGDGGHGNTNEFYRTGPANGGNGGIACAGAIHNINGTVFMRNCTFAANYSGGGQGGNGYFGGNGGVGGTAQGGAICDAYNGTGIDIHVVNCTFYGNTAAAGDGGKGGNAWSGMVGPGNGGNGGNGGYAEGGAIYFIQGCPDPLCTGIVHGTIDQNQIVPGAGKKGGLGINGGGLGADGVNGVARGGGLYAPSAGDLPINNTIIAGNFATFHFTTGAMVYEGPDVYNNVDTFKYNFIGVVDATSSGWSAGFDFTGSTTAPLDPLLGPLQINNGGETPTQAPLSCSPVIDKGSAATFSHDQILQVRPVGITTPPYFVDGSDIGAFELQSFPTTRPLLGILRSFATNTVTISWPYEFNCFALQQNADLATTNWVAVMDAVSVVSNRCQVAVTPSVNHEFYRLVHP